MISLGEWAMRAGSLAPSAVIDLQGADPWRGNLLMRCLAQGLPRASIHARIGILGSRLSGRGGGRDETVLAHIIGDEGLELVVGAI